MKKIALLVMILAVAVVSGCASCGTVDCDPCAAPVVEACSPCGY